MDFYRWRALALTAISIWRLGCVCRDLEVDLSAADPSYWDGVYDVHAAHGRSEYEWYGLGFADLEELLGEVLAPDAEILVAGAGDSKLSSDIAARGHSVVSIDFSPSVVGRMRWKYPQLSFEVMDARNMTFADGRFDAFLDKGLSDCLGTSHDLREYFSEVRRVLRSKEDCIKCGVAVVVSMRQLEEEHIGPGWACDPTREHMGPLFMDTSEFQPAMPKPGTDGTIPYYITVCRTKPLYFQEL